MTAWLVGAAGQKMKLETAAAVDGVRTTVTFTVQPGCAVVAIEPYWTARCLMDNLEKETAKERADQLVSGRTAVGHK